MVTNSGSMSGATPQFTFVDRLPAEGASAWYAHYDHAELPVSGWRACDLRAVLRTHQDAWLDAFDDWHAELSRLAVARSSWWWCLSGSRATAWVPRDTLKPLFFAAALREWSRLHGVDDVHVVGAPEEVGGYLEEFAHGPGAPVVSASWRGRAWRRVAAWAMRSLAKPRLSVPKAEILVYSHVLGAAALEEAGDHFFGGLLEELEAAVPGGMVVGYLLERNEERERAMQLLARTGRRFTFVMEQLTAGDVAWVAATVMWVSLRLMRLAQVAPAIQLGQWRSRRFVGRYVQDEIAARPAVIELGLYRAMRRVLSRTGAKTIVYPYEEKPLEHALLRACGDAATPVRSVACAHAVQTTCHLALRGRLDARANPPQPDQILATGPAARTLLIQWGRKSPSAVAVAGSSRHIEPVDPPRPLTARRSSLRVLLLIGHEFELETFSHLMERHPEIFAGDEIVVRRYPFGWHEAQDRAMARLVAAGGRVRADAEPLREQLAWCDVALCASSSTGIQAMLAGRAVIWTGLHDLWVADPLLGQHEGLLRCERPAELGEALAQVRALSDEAYVRLAARQRSVASSIFAPPDRAQFVRHVLGRPGLPATTVREAELVDAP